MSTVCVKNCNISIYLFSCFLLVDFGRNLLPEEKISFSLSYQQDRPLKTETSRRIDRLIVKILPSVFEPSDLWGHTGH